MEWERRGIGEQSARLTGFLGTRERCEGLLNEGFASVLDLLVKFANFAVDPCDRSARKNVVELAQ